MSHSRPETNPLPTDAECLLTSPDSTAVVFESALQDDAANEHRATVGEGTLSYVDQSAEDFARSAPSEEVREIRYRQRKLVLLGEQALLQSDLRKLLPQSGRAARRVRAS